MINWKNIFRIMVFVNLGLAGFGAVIMYFADLEPGSPQEGQLLGMQLAFFAMGLTMLIVYLMARRHEKPEWVKREIEGK